MTQKSNLPEKNNPLKASYYAHRRPTNQATDDRLNAFWDEKKTSNPALYRKHKRLNDAVDAQRAIFEASLDDPELIAVFEYFSEKTRFDGQNKLTNELNLLGVAAGATKREIRNAYRRKARK